MPGDSHGLKEFRRRVLGVTCHKPNEVVALYGIQPCEKRWKSPAVGVDVLPEQRDVLITRFDKTPDLFFNTSRVAAALPAPRVGHDAVGAEVVAAVHCGNPSSDARLTADRNILRNGRRAAVDVGRPAALGQSFVHSGRQLEKGICAKHNVDVLVLFCNLLDPVRLLHHTSGDGNDESRPAGFLVAKRTQISQQFQFRVLSDGAGIKEN
ncbi:hypothetical protein SDC9_158459 [bioreactor metagenome]|uniref:Uncharacterized protein n=1 Tax=bioreactor metagenome TaxID=1076179 RepID=A0A645F9V6_9ZZZZ